MYTVQSHFICFGRIVHVPIERLEPDYGAPGRLFMCSGAALNCLQNINWTLE